MNRILTSFKQYFIAGLIAILPLWITYYTLLIIFNLTASLARPMLRFIPSLSSTPLLLDAVSFVGTIFIVLLMGVFLKNVIGRQVFHSFEKSIQGIPLLSWVYTSIRKLTNMFYKDEPFASRFERVVMIEFPKKGTYVIGFVTSSAPADVAAKTKREMINVFVPTTPNPTSGFLFLVAKEEATPLAISAEHAVKLIMSGGILNPEEA